MILTLIRGISGSGKSTVASALSELTGAAHFEADMYFLDEKGNYNFKQDELKHAHAWCRDSVAEALEAGDDVVVANTFVKIWEMEPYLEMVQKYDARLQIIHVMSEFDSIHDVPPEVIQRQARNWEEIGYEAD